MRNQHTPRQCSTSSSPRLARTISRSDARLSENALWRVCFLKNRSSQHGHRSSTCADEPSYRRSSGTPHNLSNPVQRRESGPRACIRSFCHLLRPHPRVDRLPIESGPCLVGWPTSPRLFDSIPGSVGATSQNLIAPHLEGHLVTPLTPWLPAEFRIGHPGQRRSPGKTLEGR